MISSLKNHRWLVATALVAAVALAAACGGSTSKLPAAGSAPRNSGGGSSTELQSSAPPPSDAAKGGVKSSSAPTGDVVTGGAGSTGTADGGASPDQLPPQLDRKIIQTATLSIESGEVSKKFEDAGNIAAAAGGFVSSSSFGNSGDRQTASVTIRVPGNAYQRVLGDLRKLGDVKSEDSGANDVTEQYTDLASRLRNLQATEARYSEFLGKAQNITEVLTVQDRLNSTRGEIEQVQGRINLLDHQTDMATITLHLDPPPIAKAEPPKPAGSRSPFTVAADSFQASLAVLLGLATVALAVAAFSWWLVPVGAVAAYVARRQQRAMQNNRQAPPPPPAAPIAPTA